MKSLLSSFAYAFRGIADLILKERNFQIHLLILALVIAAGFFFGITREEWITIILVSGAVLAAEGFNTSIEKIADFIEPEKNDKIKKIKDIAAGAVLITAIMAAVIGCMIFWPYIK